MGGFQPIMDRLGRVTAHAASPGGLGHDRPAQGCQHVGAGRGSHPPRALRSNSIDPSLCWSGANWPGPAFCVKILPRLGRLDLRGRGGRPHSTDQCSQKNLVFLGEKSDSYVHNRKQTKGSSLCLPFVSSSLRRLSRLCRPVSTMILSAGWPVRQRALLSLTPSVQIPLPGLLLVGPLARFATKSHASAAKAVQHPALIGGNSFIFNDRRGARLCGRFACQGDAYVQ